jgi:hypothetical protein
MRVRLLLELDTGGVGDGAMEDWIDRLKRKEQGQDERTIQQNELRLQQAQIIKAKGPSLWKATIDFIEAYCRKLREAFPNDAQRRCHLDSYGDRVVIVNEGPFPRLELSVEPKWDGQCIDLVEAEKYDRDQPARITKRGHIEMTVNDLEALECRYIGKAHTTPESLAQALVSHVCKISEPR